MNEPCSKHDTWNGCCWHCRESINDTETADENDVSARELVRDCSPVTLTMARKADVTTDLRGLEEDGLVEYENQCWYWIGDEDEDEDDTERADAQYVDGAGNPISPNEYVDDSLEDNAICDQCGESHENGACWDETDDGGDTYILEDAIETVYERPEQHGEPEDSFLTIARLWSTYLGTVQEEGRQIVTPSDVAMMMALLKIARSAEGHYDEDNPRDCAGYMECYARLKEGSQ